MKHHKEITEEKACGGFIWTAAAVKRFIQAGNTLPGGRGYFCCLLIYSSKTVIHNKSSTGFRNVLVHRGSFCNLKVLNARGLPLTGRKPVMETSLLRCKGHNNRGKILCQHIYFQSRGFNQGKCCSQDNLEHITPSKEACTFASITMINISNKKNAWPWMPPHKGSRQGSVVNFWRFNSDSNHGGQIGFHGHLEFISSFCWGFETYHWNAHLWNFPWYHHKEFE